VYLQTITFKRIYDLRKGQGRAGAYMTFKFDAEGIQGQRAHSIIHADLESGETFTLAMSKPEDWGRIYGFWDPGRRKLYARISTDIGHITAYSVMYGFGLAVLGSLVVLNWQDLTPTHRWESIAFLLAMTIFSYVHVRKVVLERRAAKALMDFAKVRF